MLEREELQNEIVREFEQQIDKALSVCPDLCEESRSSLKDKYMETFEKSIKMGIIKTFGECATPAAATDLPAPGDDVTAEDIEKMQYAMTHAASRRSRYPKQLSERLEKTLDANYKTLQVLKADIPEIEVDLPATSESLDVQTSNLQAANNTIRTCKDQLTESLEKAGRLIGAFNILKSNQNTS